MTTSRPTIRVATADDRLAVARIVDAAALEVEGLVRRLDAGDVLLAVEERPRARSGHAERTTDGRGRERALGAVVLKPCDRGAHVVAIAVRRRLRDRGVGTALIEAAREREGRLVAEFDASVTPFYDSLDFSVGRLRGGRCRGVLEGPTGGGPSSRRKN